MRNTNLYDLTNILVADLSLILIKSGMDLQYAPYCGIAAGRTGFKSCKSWSFPVINLGTPKKPVAGHCAENLWERRFNDIGK